MERKAFSVCFDWQGEAGECEAGTRLLLPDLGGQLEDGGICVTVIREPGDTLSVCRDGSSARIIYGRRVQFFRALAQQVSLTYQDIPLCERLSRNVGRSRAP